MNNNEIDIVFDGSFVLRSLTIGLGVVRGDLPLSEDTILSVPITRDPNKPRPLLLEKKGSLIAEMLAAKLALDSIKEPAHINLFGDCKEVVDIINGWGHQYNTNKLGPALKCLASSVGSHKCVQAFHSASREAYALHPAVFGIAHNASAMASGGIKTERTPDYDGPFSHRAILFQGFSQRKFNRLTHSGDLVESDPLTVQRRHAYLYGREFRRPGGAIERERPQALRA